MHGNRTRLLLASTAIATAFYALSYLGFVGVVISSLIGASSELG